MIFKTKMSADNCHITDQNALHFLTFTVTDWIEVFTRKEYTFEIVNSLNFCIKRQRSFGLDVNSDFLQPIKNHDFNRNNNCYAQ